MPRDSFTVYGTDFEQATAYEKSEGQEEEYANLAAPN